MPPHPAGPGPDPAALERINAAIARLMRQVEGRMTAVQRQAYDALLEAYMAERQRGGRETADDAEGGRGRALQPA